MRTLLTSSPRSLLLAVLWLGLPHAAGAQVQAPIQKNVVKPPAAAIAVPPCTLPPNLPSTYDAAKAALNPPGTFSRFDVRRNDVASDRQSGMIVNRTVTQNGVRCLVVFDVSKGPPPITTTTVPSVSGFVPTDAINRLKQFDLQARVILQSSASREGRVFDQRPAAGTTVDKGSTVSVYVATPPLVDVPNVIGRQRAEAQTLLSKFSMRVNTKASTRPKGEVIDQDPREPAQRPLGSSVTVVESDGSLVVVPQLVGRTDAQAASLLKEVGLGATLAQRPSAQREGQVIQQNEPAGKAVPRGTTVTAYVAIPLPLSVPNVIGMREGEAAAQLSRFTVKSGQSASTAPRGEVVNQDPHAPAQRPPKSVVSIFVSDGSRVFVPDVMRLQLDAARKAVTERDLATGQIEQVENRAAPDVVLSQDPPAKTEVQRGSAVALKVSTGLAVPPVEGDMLADARTKLSAFKVSTTSVHGVEPSDRVLKQSIKPPTRAAAGTQIQLEVSDGSLVVVPRVDNMSLDDARKVLTEAGFAAERAAGPDFSFTRVISQQPAAGSPLARGSSIRLSVALPPWSWWLGALLALLLTVAVLWKPIKRWLYRVRTSVRIDPGSVTTELTEAVLNGPELRVATRIEASASQINLPDGDAT